MTSYLRNASIGADPAPPRATIVSAAVDGTVTIDLGSGLIVPGTIVLGGYTPAIGAPVEVRRRDEAHWEVLGERRYSNPATLAISVSHPVVYDVYGATVAANPLVVNAASSRSWRAGDDWSGASLPAVDTVAQGRFNTAVGYHHGCYFYGAAAFTSLAGRSCTRLRIRVHRLGSGGWTTSTPQVIGPHPHLTQPVGQPTFPWGATVAGSLAWSATADLDLPIAWGDLLITGAAAGFGHLLYATGNGNQSYASGVAADSLTGRITLDWV